MTNKKFGLPVNIFSDKVKWSTKDLWKMISDDVKADIKQQEIKELAVVY